MRMKVAQLGNPVLRQVCKRVEANDLKNPEIQALIDAMLAYVKRRNNKGPRMKANKVRNMGMSASQFGFPLAICVVDMAIGNDAFSDIHAFFNPEVVWCSGEIVTGMESCASTRGIGGLVPRFQSIRVNTMDRSGTAFEIEAADMVAVLLQHEIDHTNGTLFIDRLADPSRAHLVKEGQINDYRINVANWDSFIDVSQFVVPLQSL